MGLQGIRKLSCRILRAFRRVSGRFRCMVADARDPAEVPRSLASYDALKDSSTEPFGPVRLNRESLCRDMFG